MKSIYLAVAGVGLAALLVLATLSLGWVWSHRGSYPSGSSPLVIDEAAEAVERYLERYKEELELVEVMEFSENFYAEVEETGTGIHAMELLVDKSTGKVYPEMGPNMMWNTRYHHGRGMMGSAGRASPAREMTVTPEQARELAQRYLDANLPGATVGDAETFYGYYTLHTLMGGQIEGMLSVNGYSGAVWYHSWHGAFIGIKEYE